MITKGLGTKFCGSTTANTLLLLAGEGAWTTPHRDPEDWVKSLAFCPSIYCSSFASSLSQCKQCSFQSSGTDGELGAGPGHLLVPVIVGKTHFGNNKGATNTDSVHCQLHQEGLVVVVPSLTGNKRAYQNHLGGLKPHSEQ